MPTWSEICDDPALRDLPYKIETNRFGNIMMSPAKGWHGDRQFEILKIISQLLPEGRPIPESPIQTSDGVKVADVGWFTMDRLRPIRRATVYPIAPQICVEVLSGSNSHLEMLGKMKLYFDAGASEVWLCGEEGEMEFFTPDSPEPVEASRLCPGFPSQIELD
jgi:Uma2 family endonuclease